ncbi:MAG: division/cell wall cluster transcriptional repressor MraZ [Planctomycetota bacterium]|nr:division/cell wall cluster transcriptional repressor MraZ [Planctomycetota bacterium]
MFCGDSRHSVDAKHRVFLPKRFQAELPLDESGARIAVLTRGLDGCLYLFTEGGLEQALLRMDTEAFAGADHRKLQRLFFSYTSRVTLDASGRLLLPEKLRKLAGIQKEIVMVGARQRVEVWAAERWDAFEAEHGEAFDELESMLTGQIPGGGA